MNYKFGTGVLFCAWSGAIASHFGMEWWKWLITVSLFAIGQFCLATSRP